MNVLGDFESFPSIITEWECDEYIAFSHNFMIHSMGNWVPNVLIQCYPNGPEAGREAG